MNRDSSALAAGSRIRIRLGNVSIHPLFRCK